MQARDRSPAAVDWDSVRAQFPVTRDYLYFDLANKCPLPLFSTAALADYVDKQQRSGGDKAEWFATIESARGRFATLINAHPDEIAFTKNTSEGLNIAANCLPLSAGDTVILNQYEHPNNVYCWLNLERRGVRVKWIGGGAAGGATDAGGSATGGGATEGGASTGGGAAEGAGGDGGLVTVDMIDSVADETTKVVAISSTTYAPGTRNDIESIVRYCRDRGIYTVVDAVQSVGTLDVDVKALGMDILCTSAHKSLFCPHGIGVFYARPEVRDLLDPVYVARAGMGMAAQIEYGQISYTLDQSNNAKKFEIGNHNYLGLTVLDASLAYLLALGMPNVEARLIDLNAYLVQRLTGAGYRVVSPADGPWRSAIVCFRARTDAQSARDLHGYLERNGAITTLRRDTIRASLGIYNNESDIDRLVDLLRRYGTESAEPSEAR
ncbi:MAG: aminotransferase class V-fold PLP-dependent enzyme [Spirochaetaceae bacterium]|nr:MAG: aminotransferase class V-fold PLP-dependent enzyme [Spirochaetaceae bacterium]